HEDGGVHLGGAGDHVLDVVGVARAVDVRVVARGRLVLDVGDGDGDDLGVVAHDAALGDAVVADECAAELVDLPRHDGRRERGFAVVDVADGADVDVRLGPGEDLFDHVTSAGFAAPPEPAGEQHIRPGSGEMM